MVKILFLKKSLPFVLTWLLSVDPENPWKHVGINKYHSRADIEILKKFNCIQVIDDYNFTKFKRSLCVSSLLEKLNSKQLIENK